MTRRYSSTAQATTLAAGCTSAATTIQVTATTGFPAVDFVLALDYGAAGQELVLVTNVSGTTLTVTRGYNSTPTASHALGAAVAHVHAAQDFTDSRTHEAATTGVHGTSGAVVGTTDTQALSNKDLSSGTNTFPASLATDVEVSTAVSSGVSTHAALTATHGATGAVVGTTNAQVLTNKTIALGSNTVSGTTAQFNAANTDGDFATIGGIETLTSKTLTAPTITTPTITGTITVGTLAAKPMLVCTSATRPAHDEGQPIYETDTDKILVSNGSAWLVVYSAGDVFTGNEGHFLGSTPALGTPKIIKQGSVTVVTAVAGGVTFNYHDGAFPNGLVSVLVMAGDNSVAGMYTIPIFANCTLAAWNGIAYNNAGALAAGAGLRLNYIAIGW